MSSFLGQSIVNANTATPYQRIIEPSQLGMYLNLEQAELLRIKRYHEHWRFYMGQHWKFTREDGEPLVTLNYSRAFVDKSTSWLVGKDMNIQVPDVLKNHTLPVLNEVWKYNRRRERLFEMATIGGVTGDVFVLITYVAPTPQARRINPHTQGQIRIQLLNSEQCYPQWDPLDVNVLTAMRIETIYYDDRAQMINDNKQDHMARQLHTRRFTQIITRDFITEQYQGQTPVQKANPLGEIPVVHIKNKPIPGEYYGIADMDGLIDLNRELNEKATDISDTVNYMGQPVTVVTGAKLKNIERSPKSVWSGLPAEAKVYNLTLGDNLGASVNYMGVIKSALFEVGSMPEGAFGKEQPISNTSGVALHTQYQPLSELTERKCSTFEPGLEEINYFILRHKELTDLSFRLPTNLCAHCGGRIVELTDDKGRPRKKCYMVDSQTFDFLDPKDVPVKFVRKNSFGPTVEEKPLKEAKAQAGDDGPSVWDVSDFVTPKDPETGLDMQAQPIHAAIELPEEPETVFLNEVTVDPVTGEETSTSGGGVERQLVPTGCLTPAYLNPYQTDVKMNDALPKDRMMQAELFSKYKQVGIGSKKWMMEQIPEIDDVQRVMKERQDEQDLVGNPPTEPPEPRAPPVKSPTDPEAALVAKSGGA